MKFAGTICFMVLLGLTLGSFEQKPPDLSQWKSLGEKITKWHEYCNQLLARGDFKAVAGAAKTGLSISPRDSLRARTMFSLFAGVAYENLKRYDTAESYLIYAATTAPKIRNQNFLVLALSRLDNIYRYTNQTEKRQSVIARFKIIGDTTTSERIRESMYDVLSAYFMDEGNYDSSIYYRLRRIEIYKKLLQEKESDDSMNLAYAYTNLGNLFNELGQYRKALEYIYEGSSIIGNRALTGNEETLYLFFMDAYRGLNKEDSVLKYYQLIYQKMKGRDTLYGVLTQANYILGDYYKASNQVKAFQYTKLAYQFARKSPNNVDRIQAFTSYAHLLSLNKNYSEATGILREVLKEDFTLDKLALTNVLKTMATCFSEQRQWDSAYHYYKLFSEANTAILESSASKNIAEAEARFQNKEKQRQIENQKNEIAFARTRQLWLLGALMFAGVIAMLLVGIYRGKKKMADILEEKNKKLSTLNEELDAANSTKAKLFGIMGHDLRGPISQVYQFLKLQQLNPGALTEGQKTELNQKVQQTTGALLETMEDLLIWSKTQMEAFEPGIQPVNLMDLVAACRSLLQLNSDAKYLTYRVEIPEGLVVQSDPNYLQAIIRNLLQNAIKAAPVNSAIRIAAIAGAGKTVMSIENEGKVFTQEDYERTVADAGSNTSLAGLGLKLVDELSRKVNVQIRFSTTGTTTMASVILE